MIQLQITLSQCHRNLSFDVAPSNKNMHVLPSNSPTTDLKKTKQMVYEVVMCEYANVVSFTVHLSC